MKKLIGLISCLSFVYLLGAPIDTYGLEEEGKSCDYARCKNLGEDGTTCEPGNKISLRDRCQSLSCIVAESCDWAPEFPE